ncbi:unnamed protein product [Amoebophrya sp. A120]|nr:unnamed protein product [Amoebophrya sp. A120]|eukprot:GSA120T00012030001.1
MPSCGLLSVKIVFLPLFNALLAQSLSTTSQPELIQPSREDHDNIGPQVERVPDEQQNVMKTSGISSVVSSQHQILGSPPRADVKLRKSGLYEEQEHQRQRTTTHGTSAGGEDFKYGENKTKRKATGRSSALIEALRSTSKLPAPTQAVNKTKSNLVRREIQYNEEVEGEDGSDGSALFHLRPAADAGADRNITKQGFASSASSGQRRPRTPPRTHLRGDDASHAFLEDETRNAEVEEPLHDVHLVRKSKSSESFDVDDEAVGEQRPGEKEHTGQEQEMEDAAGQDAHDLPLHLHLPRTTERSASTPGRMKFFDEKDNIFSRGNETTFLENYAQRGRQQQHLHRNTESKETLSTSMSASGFCDASERMADTNAEQYTCADSSNKDCYLVWHVDLEDFQRKESEGNSVGKECLLSSPMYDASQSSSTKNVAADYTFAASAPGADVGSGLFQSEEECRTHCDTIRGCNFYATYAVPDWTDSNDQFHFGGVACSLFNRCPCANGGSRCTMYKHAKFKTYRCYSTTTTSTTSTTSTSTTTTTTSSTTSTSKTVTTTPAPGNNATGNDTASSREESEEDSSSGKTTSTPGSFVSPQMVILGAAGGIAVVYYFYAQQQAGEAAL